MFNTVGAGRKKRERKITWQNKEKKKWLVDVKRDQCSRKRFDCIWGGAGLFSVSLLKK